MGITRDTGKDVSDWLVFHSEIKMERGGSTG